VNVFALETAEFVQEADAKALLAKKCIRAETSGLIAIGFDAATRALGRNDLLKAVRNEYTRSISKSGKVDIDVVETAPGRYHYFNDRNKRVDIIELYRKQTDETSFDIVMQASGKRFFGRYDVIIHVRVIDALDAGVVYTARIHAYPHNGPIRFLARRTGAIERYFRKNTRTIDWVARTICEGLDPTFALREHDVKQNESLLDGGAHAVRPGGEASAPPTHDRRG
ncbi:MAG: hypothetical protein KJN98_06020, partial [Pontiella sp.]|nr:hypothetical protein [Pontiella sp.]